MKFLIFALILALMVSMTVSISGNFKGYILGTYPKGLSYSLCSAIYSCSLQYSFSISIYFL
ncbi:hypothetical protein H8958_000345 [Nasalis larvatus]